MPPMEQVGAGNMPPVMSAGVLEDIEQMVAAFPVDGPVGVEGHAASFRSDEMVARPIGSLSSFSRNARAAAVRVVNKAQKLRQCLAKPSGKLATRIEIAREPSAVRRGAGRPRVYWWGTVCMQTDLPPSKSHHARGCGSDGWFG